jgi:hypothetical protein
MVLHLKCESYERKLSLLSFGTGFWRAGHLKDNQKINASVIKQLAKALIDK